MIGLQEKVRRMGCDKAKVLSKLMSIVELSRQLECKVLLNCARRKMQMRVGYLIKNAMHG